MSTFGSSYRVGRGKPPLHSRFQKGQSGNPSGKPGPAKLASQRFQRALCAALEGEMADLERAEPRRNLDAMARRLALDAAAGRTQSVKLILHVLDKEVVRSDERGDEPEEAQEESVEASAAGAPPADGLSR